MLSQPLTKYLQTRPLPTHINPGFSPCPPPLRLRLAIYAEKKAIRPMHVKFRSAGIYYQKRSRFSFNQSWRKYILKPRSERLYSHFRKRGGVPAIWGVKILYVGLFCCVFVLGLANRPDGGATKPPLGVYLTLPTSVAACSFLEDCQKTNGVNLESTSTISGGGEELVTVLIATVGTPAENAASVANVFAPYGYVIKNGEVMLAAPSG